MMLHKLYASGKRVGHHHSVRVQKKNISSGSLFKSLVVCPRKSHIVFVKYESDVWEKGFKVFRTSISGCVVYHKYFMSYAFPGQGDGKKTLFQQKFNIIIDNDDGKDHG
jgi:hypothetical protein